MGISEKHIRSSENYMGRTDITEELRRIFWPKQFITLQEIMDYKGIKSKNTARKLMAGVLPLSETPGSKKKKYHIKDVSARIAECRCSS